MPQEPSPGASFRDIQRGSLDRMHGHRKTEVSMRFLYIATVSQTLNAGHAVMASLYTGEPMVYCTRSLRNVLAIRVESNRVSCVSRVPLPPSGTAATPQDTLRRPRTFATVSPSLLLCFARRSIIYPSVLTRGRGPSFGLCRERETC